MRSQPGTCRRSMHSDTCSIPGQPVIHRRFAAAQVPVLIRSEVWGGGGHNLGTPFTTHTLFCATRTRARKAWQIATVAAFTLCAVPHLQIRCPHAVPRVRAFLVMSSREATGRLQAAVGRLQVALWGPPVASFGGPLEDPCWASPLCASAPHSWPRQRSAHSPAPPL